MVIFDFFSPSHPFHSPKQNYLYFSYIQSTLANTLVHFFKKSKSQNYDQNHWLPPTLTGPEKNHCISSCLLFYLPRSKSQFKTEIEIGCPFYDSYSYFLWISIGSLNSVKFQNFDFKPKLIFWWKITKMITRVNSCIFTSSPYIGFLKFFAEIVIIEFAKNPGIHPSYNFCDFASKMTI